MSVFSGFLSLSSSLKKIFVMTMSPVLSVWQDASRVSALGAGGGVVPCCSRDDSFDEPPELALVTDVELDLDERPFISSFFEGCCSRILFSLVTTIVLVLKLFIVSAKDYFGFVLI
uniref:(northern house mosquito) hypothetical protein n=1 Tax=Culex pipiens TaxID=7175 RepID=A0A8D8NM39_CULPI